ncbi:uncharacterized protein LOC119975535 [Scyliorhinus canicula]|uniref:uncharacterized protein LOC119975535 n=1 Tax=Scyliorhinus canicula TaxID=7830 RepID=UPI0018F27F9E|nr:uncharacterized protein LOC119975535 [Scyliorhinus canicula]
MNISAILWILAVFLGINADKLSVLQKLPSILAEAGQDVHIPCNFTVNITKVIGSYKWFKDSRNGTQVFNETKEYRGRIYRSKEDFLHARDASILIRDVRVNDSGVYYCQVMVMQRGEEYGAGTWLTVRDVQLIHKLSSIQALEGQAVFIPCTHTAPASHRKENYKWYKNSRNGTEISNGTAQYKGRIFRPKHKDIFNASIQIRDLKVNDSGFYYCSLEVRGIGKEYGVGTHLIVKDVQLSQRQDTVSPEIVCVDDNIMTPLQGLDTNQEEQPIYTPMESLKTFSNSMGNLMDSQSSLHNSQNETTAIEYVQYATIKLDLLKQSSSLVIVERDDSEHDYGYDELNITAKRYPQLENISVNEGNGTNSEEFAAVADGCGNEDLETNLQF